MQEDFITVSEWRKRLEPPVSRQRASQWLKAGRLGVSFPACNLPNAPRLIHKDTPRPEPLPAGRPPREGRK